MTSIQDLSDDQLMAIMRGGNQPGPSPGRRIEDASDRELEALAMRGGNADNWGMASQAMDWISLGGSKKINAAGGALIDSAIDAFQGEGFPYSENYNRNLIEQKRDQAAYSEQHPTRKRVADVAGIGASIPLLPIAAPFKAAGVTSKLGNAAVTGGAYGAGAGAIEDANSIEERLGNTAQGGSVGAAIGAAALPVSSLMGKAARYGRDSVSRLASGNSKTEDAALRLIAREAENSGLTPKEALTKALAFGPEGMLADASPGLQATVGASARLHPKASALAAERLGDRRGRTMDRLVMALDDALGPGTDPAHIEAMTKQIKRSAGPGYERAKQHDVGTGMVLAHLDAELAKMGKAGPRHDAFTTIRKMLTKPDGKAITNGGEVHLVRQQIDDMMSSAHKAGNSQLAGQLKPVRVMIDKLLDQGVPGFTASDKTYKSANRLQDSYDEGRFEILKGGPHAMSPEQLRANMGKSNDAENALRRKGVRTELARALAGSGDSSARKADYLLNQGWNRDKVGTLAGPQRARKLEGDLERERVFRETSRYAEPKENIRHVTRDTMERISPSRGPGAAADIAGSAAAGFAFGGMQGAGIAAAGRAAGRLGQAVRTRLSKDAEDLVALATTDYLTISGAQRQQIGQRLVRIAQELQRAGAMEEATRVASYALMIQGGAQMDQSRFDPARLLRSISQAAR